MPWWHPADTVSISRKIIGGKGQKTSTLLIGNGDVHIMNINEHVALLRRFPTIRGTEKGFFC